MQQMTLQCYESLATVSEARCEWGTVSMCARAALAVGRLLREEKQVPRMMHLIALAEKERLLIYHSQYFYRSLIYKELRPQL